MWSSSGSRRQLSGPYLVSPACWIWAIWNITRGSTEVNAPAAADCRAPLAAVIVGASGPTFRSSSMRLVTQSCFRACGAGPFRHSVGYKQLAMFFSPTENDGGGGTKQVACEPTLMQPGRHRL